jgi:hypothetical protein
MIDSFAPAGTIRLGDVSSQPVAELINTVKATSERRVLPRRGR